MNEDYSQPFWVGWKNQEKFPFARYGYLPALELPEIEPQAVSEPIVWKSKEWDIVLQLKAEVVGWRQKHSELQLEVEKLIKILDKKGIYLYE